LSSSSNHNKNHNPRLQPSYRRSVKTRHLISPIQARHQLRRKDRHKQPRMGPAYKGLHHLLINRTCIVSLPPALFRIQVFLASQLMGRRRQCPPQPRMQPSHTEITPQDHLKVPLRWKCRTRTHNTKAPFINCKVNSRGWALERAAVI